MKSKPETSYKTGWNVLYNIAQVFWTFRCWKSVGSGVGAVGMLSTGIGAAVAVPLSGIAIAWRHYQRCFRRS